MAKTLTYPLKFTPILKEKIWGGEKLKTLLNKKSESTNIGESWEISDVPENVSIVNNGELKGKSLKEILTTYKSQLIGEKNYSKFGNNFPLLIKFIDAKTDLSIQVHPNDALAAKRHNSFGKTEMWYVLQAETNAKLIVGFKPEINAKKYQDSLVSKTLPQILNSETVKTAEAYFIEAGRIHAIGAGVLLAEIQQTSDHTYRLYDWDRVDQATGKERELHTQLAEAAINFNLPNNYKIEYSKKSNAINNMVSCVYFTTNYLFINKTITKENTFDSFIIYMCVSGEAAIQNENAIETIKAGETILVPATIKQFQIVSKNASLLEVYV